MTKGLEKQTFGDFLCFFRGQTIDRRKGKPLSQEQLGILLTDQLGLIISRNKVNNWETNKISPHPQRDRELMVAVVEILKKHNGIKSLDDANQLFEAGNYQALTDQEINQIDPGWK